MQEERHRMQELKTSFPIERITKSRLSETDFDNLKFGQVFSDHLLIADFSQGNWNNVRIAPYKDLSFSPAASVFHYGQAIFEGLKGHKDDNNDVLLFRPRKNWERINASAIRMCMPEIPEEIFMDGIKALIQLDKDWVPNGEGKSLYIRPFMIADEPSLGVKASSTYKFIVITSPTSNYYSGSVSVKIEDDYSRAASGGIGAAKAAANYAASLYPAQKAQSEGYNQLIWTDASEHKFIEESGTMNIMFKINGKLITPSITSDTILKGVTRDSIIQLANKWGYDIEERRVPVTELVDGLQNGAVEEAFGMGTAATIAPIHTIGYKDKKYQLTDSSSWEFSNKAKDYLEALKRGKIEDEFNWIERI